jgi:hypothetical protein
MAPLVLSVFFLSMFLLAITDEVHTQTSSASPKVDLSDLRTIIEKRPNSLVGYSLVDCHVGPDCHIGPAKHYGSMSSRAMVMSVDTGKSYELLRELPSVVPRAATSFAGWLPGHRTAIIAGVFFPAAVHTGESQDYWIDEYILNLITGRFFTPTGVMPSGYQNNGMLPFKSSTESGYLFFTGVGPGLADEYKMHFDGSEKKPFPGTGNRFGSHGCWTSPTGELTACELAPCNGAIQACIQIYNLQTGAAGPKFGPSPIGAVSWSPDGRRFVYLGGTTPVTCDNALMLVDVQANTTIRIGGTVIHNCGPGHGIPGEEAFDGGTELGEWSASGDAYYTSIVVGSGANRYNRIGRFPLANPDTFVPLTPEGIDARYPALAPTGNSFVCLAISKKPDESPIQIYRVDSSNTGQPKFKQVSHIVASKVPNLPSWRVETHVKVNYIP